MSFLKAEWRKLAIANYEVDPHLLKADLPFGTELDLWQDRCYVSLVGFRFVNTRLLGIPIPFHTHFEEVNLRFYVKRKAEDGWRRGVVFIQEIVPKPALSWVANTVYKEHYVTLPMRYHWREHPDHREVGYAWKKAGQWQEFALKAQLAGRDWKVGSETEFITEHYWGYARINDQKSNEYEVTHPSWKVYEVIDSDIQVDFGLTYGKRFSFLNEQEPLSCMLAEGSEITVESKRTIKS